MREMLPPGGGAESTVAGFRLEDRYTAAAGRVHLTGIQALIRGVVDTLRADRAAGQRTGGYVSGYQGSPLGSVDKEAIRASRELPELDLHFQPGLNEELGATAVWGSQLAPERRGARVDGVLGVWFGKAPGLDRATDAIRHGNVIGTHPLGGVVALVGDDPASKSSTLPSASEATLAAIQVPILYPGNVQEAVDLVRHAAALSRASGLWAAVKVVTAVADAHGTLRVSPERVRPQRPERPWPGHGAGPYRHQPNARILPPGNLDMERSLAEVRLPLAVDYLRANGLNVVHGCRDGRAALGIVAAGRTWHDLVQMLHDVGLDERRLADAGVRLLQVRAPWPADREGLRAFADGLDEVVVVEEKHAFLETQLRDALYGRPGAPRIVGERDEHDRPLVPVVGELNADLILEALAPRLRERLSEDEAARIDARRDALRRRPAGGVAITLPMAGAAPSPARTPFFCSGCPHNTSLKAPDGTVVGAGIGCHVMALIDDAGKGEVTGSTQMGGEGAQWVGMAPFVDLDDAFVQNVGDGTFAHSGSLALRFAVASGQRMVYRLLYNDAVAMTGGQAIEGGMTVPALTRLLEAEGVQRTIVTTERLEEYRGVELAANAEVRDRDRVDESLAELRALDGVTVLLHDQRCAAEKRRLRRRGQLERPAERAMINERVCEGCGDCGRKSSCLSVQPVDTELGRKTRIHQSSCNVDLSCLQGECPSFVTVVPADRRRGLGGWWARRQLARAAAGAEAAPRPSAPDDLPAPPWAGGPDAREFTVRMCGIGGTGVVTVSHLLGVAALLEGREAIGLDQTGLSQKGGNVISDVRIGDHTIVGGPRASARTLDALLAFDLLGATNAVQLAGADPERTFAVLSTSEVPTGEQVVDPHAAVHHSGPLADRVRARSREALALDAVAIAEALVGDHLAANVVVLGAAVQAGAVPLRPASIERAITLGGVAVDANVAAFRWGRAAVARPDALRAALHATGVDRPLAMDLPGADPLALPTAETPLRVDHHRPAGDGDRDERRIAALPAALRAQLDALAAPGDAATAALRHVLAVRTPELVAYQDQRLAERYLREVAEVAAVEADRAPGSTAIRVAFARGLHHLLAAKDEYEIARLHLDPDEQERIRREFGPGARVRIQLDPPQLRRFHDGKIGLGSWIRPSMRALYRARRLRGTALDPFGRTEVRRTDRALPGEYRTLVDRALRRLRPATAERIAAVAALAETVRGYEQVRLDAVARFREAGAAALAELEATDAPAPVAAD
ncbi:indolepyruvate ferredoxin oxidoreductase family protein [Patulibacter defluvii]|uniref:indolepyruvate ferredoxin oxidoreductase family protein n=1 Tax=Patulibacter defluvii TaxID=3095358 RepID=UPI002A74EB59|nr:indolepyruvate ferredoxin oxidoreductase family protein [Patulibacter sp. DM4]